MSDLAVAARAVLVVVMAAAAYGKLRGADLRPVLRAMQLPAVPGWLVGAVELACAALLIVMPVAGAMLALGLLVAFTAGLANALRRGSHVPCHCFGASSAPIARNHLVRNVLLLGTAAAALAPASTSIAAAAAGALVGVAILAWDDLVALLAPLGGVR